MLQLGMYLNLENFVSRTLRVGYRNRSNMGGQLDGESVLQK